MSAHFSPGTIPTNQTRGETRIIRFYKRKVLDAFKTKETGSKVFNEVDFLKIIHPGEKDFVDRRVNAIDKERYPEQWNNYIANKGQVVGTPIEKLFEDHDPSTAPDMTLHFRQLHIETIEQLAAISDGAMSGIQFGLEFRQRAQKFLETAKANEPNHFEEKLQQQAAEIQELRQRLQDTIAQIPQKRPRGRPRKVAVTDTDTPPEAA